MIKKVRLALHLMMNMGLRYTLFRVFFEFKKRTGFLKKSFPVNPGKVQYINFASWKESNHFYIQPREAYLSHQYNFEVNKVRNENQKKGSFLFFSSLNFDLGENYDWVTNPDTNYNYDINKHWVDINDFDINAGDIKYVWEKSRFSYLYLTIRNDIKFKTDSSEYVFKEIKSWIDSNPINQGPNFKCSQEISLRTLNWYYALQFYKNSIHLTEELFQEIMHVIYWQLKHVYANIHFSRIAVRNNHAITETLMLYLGGLIFPYFPESKTWLNKGKSWFEQEVKYQVYEDGTFLQFSMNYHRVLIQLFNVAFKVSSHYKEQFSDFVYKRAYKSLDFLYQSQDLKTGYLPNYGANDGALFFPLTNCDYRDYRPSLNTLHYLLTSQNLYELESVKEELVLLNIKSPVKSYSPIEKRMGWSEYRNGGYYILNELNSITFIRCGNHKDRPSQADNLHLDIWYNSKNILRDNGSYKYNTTEEKINYFFGTESHNTVKVEQYNQMLKGKRFIWYYWSQRNNASVWENDDCYNFKGSINAFKYLNKSIIHTRTIEKQKNNATWIIVDTIENKSKTQKIRQLWHFDEMCLNENNFQSDAEIKLLKTGYSSSMYGSFDESQYLSFESYNNSIKTTIKT